MKNLFKQLFLISSLICLIACSNSEEQNSKNNSVDSNIIISKKVDTRISKTNKKLNPQIEKIKISDYNFEYGYYDFDEESFTNPGFLKIFKNNIEIFSDTFNGEGNVYIKSLGYQNLSGNKLIFTLNWGTEACDFTQQSRYYFITPENKVHFINEYWSSSGGDGYATRYYSHILPNENDGIPNSIIILEGMIFHKKDQPNQEDTTILNFYNNNFKTQKITNNLSKVK